MWFIDCVGNAGFLLLLVLVWFCFEISEMFSESGEWVGFSVPLRIFMRFGVLHML